MSDIVAQKNPAKNELQLRARFFGKDLQGDISVERAFLAIKGVSYTVANALAKMNNDILTKKIGEFSVDEITALEDKIRQDLKKMPVWMMNKCNQPLTGKNEHIIESDLDFFEKQIFDIEKDSKSRKGIRRQRKLTVRGQKTHTSGRINRTKQQSRKKDVRQRKHSAENVGKAAATKQQANQPTKKAVAKK
ncbi:MAG: 30S ribosomal protein S13 [Euryarchaeota archaeon HGW-Euryarchaeota-1]|nr:MAG: 30S ribosomal protein S13 [Euryarchaeota archaeon HGW-Euryarchaeota-1]